MLVWMAWPLGKCVYAGMDHDHDGMTEVYEWFYPADGEEPGNRPRRSFTDNAGLCITGYPVAQYMWQPITAGGLFLGWIVFRRLRLIAYHRQVKKAQRHY